MQIFALTILMHRDGRLVAVLDRPDNILGTKRRVATEEDAVASTHHRGLVDNRAVPLVELDADVTLDPRKRIVLPDGQYDVIAGNNNLARRRTTVDTPILLDVVFHQVKLHADKLAVLVDEFFW